MAFAIEYEHGTSARRKTIDADRYVSHDTDPPWVHFMRGDVAVFTVRRDAVTTIEPLAVEQAPCQTGQTREAGESGQVECDQVPDEDHLAAPAAAPAAPQPVPPAAGVTQPGYVQHEQPANGHPAGWPGLSPAGPIEGGLMRERAGSHGDPRSVPADVDHVFTPRAPQQVAPQHVTPHQVAPRETVPQQVARQEGVPQQVTPQRSPAGA